MTSEAQHVLRRVVRKGGLALAAIVFDPGRWTHVGRSPLVHVGERGDRCSPLSAPDMGHRVQEAANAARIDHQYPTSYWK